MRKASESININGRRLGHGQPCFVIAEAGVNHNGDIGLAMKLVDAASEAGADAVKFQSFKAANLVTADAPQAEYQARNIGKTESQYAMLERLEFTQEAHGAVADHCARRGIIFLSTPFDAWSAELLHGIGVPLFKISSGDLTDLPHLARIAAYGRPMIVSTGMGTLGEVEAALDTIAAGGNPPVALLHCVTNYPALMAEANLRAMTTLLAAFGLPTGYSDHCLGPDACLAAVAMGACIIEKHLTLDKHLSGPDHLASMEPDELKAMIRSIRGIEAALGDGIKRPGEAELRISLVVRKSIAAARHIPDGAVICADDLTTRRPGTGLAPALIPHILGRTVRAGIAAGALLGFQDLE